MSKPEELPVSDEFNAAAKDFADVTKNHSLSSEEQLGGYALYKQAKFGDNTSKQPGWAAIGSKDKAKWDAYEAKKGIKPEEAQTQYIAYVAEIKKKYES